MLEFTNKFEGSGTQGRTTEPMQRTKGTPCRGQSELRNRTNREFTETVHATEEGNENKERGREREGERGERKRER